MAVIDRGGNTYMKMAMGKRRLLLLGLVLLLVVIANAIIFVPHFITSQQMLTAEELAGQQQQLAESARQASRVMLAAVDQPEQLDQHLQPLTQKVDETVLQLRTSTHPVDLDEEVKETLRLAEVLSFTLRTAATHHSGNSLLAAKTAQIFEQSAQSVEQLQRNYRVD